MSAWGRWIPMTSFLKSRSISFWSRLAASRGLFPWLSLLSCFCFDFNASHVIANGWPMINESPFFVRWRSTEVINPLRVVASYSLPDFFRTDNRNPLRKVSIWPVADLQVFDSLSPSRETPKATSSPLRFARNFSTSVSVCKTNFSAIVRANLRNKQLWIGNKINKQINSLRCFAIHQSTRLSGAKGEWRFCSWLAISTQEKKYDIFFTCVVTAFLRARSIFLFAGWDLYLVFSSAT